ncbi:MAG: phosphomannomutase/phosphoglucomutase [Alphaproteobacteria bacterium]|nr:phosphomannomutase/phosphoglucomutase [Alphaproteobacteria bacterium]
MKHNFHPTILREYDVRGVVGETLAAADARAVGRSFGTALVRDGGKRVAVGYDGRLSSPEMEAAVVEGLASCGLDVIRVGLGPTPMTYFAVKHLGTDGGLMVTGSHNPSNYNGFKMATSKGPFYGDAIKALGARAASADFAKGTGKVTEHAVFDAYVDRVFRDYDGQRPLDVAWDAGNGAAGPAMVALTKRLPGRHAMIHQAIDGRFPNHHPDPTVESNLAQLKELVAKEGSVAGIAFDGDGDRIGAVDGKGRVLWGDQMMMLLARDVLRDKPGSTIIADVKASQALFDEVARLGGKPLMWRTGHSLIKAKMAETGSPLAGEMSGHIFFADRYYGYDDALYAAIRLINVIARSGKTLAELRDELPQMINTPELRFPCADERKFQVVEELKARLKAEEAKVDDIDGVRVSTPDGWWLLRASNTQDVLVARCEASSTDGLQRLKDTLAGQLRKSGIEPPQDSQH